MNNTQIEKLHKFANDKVMTEAVYNILLEVFLKKGSEEDVSIKAARFISVEKLQDAWKEIDKFKSDEKGEEPIRQQIGL